jgi:hypothetical protein
MWFPILAANAGEKSQSAAAKPAQNYCVLVSNSKPYASIVLAENPTRPAQIAAAELRHYVKKRTGAELPWTTDAAPPGPSRPKVLIGESKLTRELGLNSSDFARQEYLIRVVGNCLVLMGCDEQDFGVIDYDGNGTWPGFFPIAPTRGKFDIFKGFGSLYAVDTFLERFAGVRWYLPTEVGEVVPQSPQLVAKDVDLRLKPWTRYRLIYPPNMNEPFHFAGSRLGAKALPQISGWREWFLWLLRMKVGGEPFNANHSLYGYYERFSQTHPEWFANGDPKNGKQLCYTQPGLIRQVAQDARDYFDGKGIQAGAQAAGEFFPVMPMDNSKYCQCPNCKALQRPGEAWQFNSGEASDYIWGFVNAVAREVRKTHPDKLISCCAYAKYFEPPKNVQMEPNVAVMVCKQLMLYGDSRLEPYDHKNLEEWRKRVKHLYIWEYYNFPQNMAECMFPGTCPHRIARDIGYVKPLGIAGEFIEMDSINSTWPNPAMDHINVYVTLKLLDDPSRSVDDILDEYYKVYYGPADKPMRAFFEKIESIYTNPAHFTELVAAGKQHLDQRTSWGSMCPPATLAEFGKIMEEARRLAAEEPYRTRVALMDAAIFRLMEANCTAFHARKGPQRVSCPMAAEPPTMDGKLDEPAWTSATPQGTGAIESFLTILGKPANVTTQARVMYDKENLYIGLTCFEPKIEGILATCTQPDGMVCTDDAIEVFIDPGRTRKSYYQITANTLGTISDDHREKVGQVNEGWKSGVRVAVSKGPDRWTMEMAIPFAALTPPGKEPANPPSPGDTWGLNLCRNRWADKSSTQDQRWMCWSPTYASFHEPAEFGILTFAK